VLVLCTRFSSNSSPSHIFIVSSFLLIAKKPCLLYKPAEFIDRFTLPRHIQIDDNDPKWTVSATIGLHKTILESQTKCSFQTLIIDISNMHACNVFKALPILFCLPENILAIGTMVFFPTREQQVRPALY
jgi:hypothetical protein